MPLDSFSCSGRILHAGLLRANLKLLGSASEVRARRKPLGRGLKLAAWGKHALQLGGRSFRLGGAWFETFVHTRSFPACVSLLPVGRGVD